jgi:hypothetical protein
MIPPPVEEPGGAGAPADYGVRGMTDSPIPGSAGVLGETLMPLTAGIYGRCSPPGACFGVYSDGDLYVDGFLTASLGKAAVVETSEGYERLWAIESPDLEFYANGEAQLQDGVAVVEFERLFREAISPDVPVRVTVSPVGGWSGLYLESADHKGFVVRSAAGDPNVTFNWIAIGRRKGYEERPDWNGLAPYGYSAERPVEAPYAQWTPR